jgi:pyruvate/2-oxoglutarate dehydrogenase complex dihydrolipoamide acyltransferase (E2) component
MIECVCSTGRQAQPALQGSPVTKAPRRQMKTPLTLPDLGVGDEELRVSCWLVDLGDAVDEGDRVIEILLDGMTFDVLAERSGTLARIERPLDAVVRTGDVLGWLESDEGSDSDADAGTGAGAA